MRQWYVTITKIQSWNEVIEADTAKDAKRKAEVMPLNEEPDFSRIEVPYVDEVKKYVE